MQIELLDEPEEELPKRWTEEEVIENCEQALKQVSDASLGYVHVLFPGKSTWDIYYVVLKDSQMQFMPSVKHHAFTHTYIINRITIRRTKKYIAIPDGKKKGETELMKKDVLLITHNFDNNALFMTAPIIFNTRETYPEFKKVILETLMEKIRMCSDTEPTEPVATLMDCTNRYSWGKLFIMVNNIINFPYCGQISVRMSVQPWTLQTKTIKDSKLEFKQGFYIPIANHFFTLKIELINMESVGFFRENLKEHVIETYEIRLSDINKDPF